MGVLFTYEKVTRCPFFTKMFSPYKRTKARNTTESFWLNHVLGESLVQRVLSQDTLLRFHSAIHIWKPRSSEVRFIIPFGSIRGML
jgi:hypothetical protein